MKGKTVRQIIESFRQTATRHKDLFVDRFAEVTIHIGTIDITKEGSPFPPKFLSQLCNFSLEKGLIRFRPTFFSKSRGRIVKGRKEFSFFILRGRNYLIIALPYSDASYDWGYHLHFLEATTEVLGFKTNHPLSYHLGRRKGPLGEWDWTIHEFWRSRSKNPGTSFSRRSRQLKRFIEEGEISNIKTGPSF